MIPQKSSTIINLIFISINKPMVASCEVTKEIPSVFFPERPPKMPETGSRYLKTKFKF